jgi:hypothetical protein
MRSWASRPGFLARSVHAQFAWRPAPTHASCRRGLGIVQGFWVSRPSGKLTRVENRVSMFSLSIQNLDLHDEGIAQHARPSGHLYLMVASKVALPSAIFSFLTIVSWYVNVSISGPAGPLNLLAVVVASCTMPAASRMLGVKLSTEQSSRFFILATVTLMGLASLCHNFKMLW